MFWPCVAGLLIQGILGLIADGFVYNDATNDSKRNQFHLSVLCLHFIDTLFSFVSEH